MGSPRVVIVGAGIGGLTLALELHAASVPCVILEAAPELRELGVGINLLPHATRSLARLGLLDALRAVAVTTRESVFYTRHGQLVYREPAGLPPAIRGRSSPSTAATCSGCFLTRCTAGSATMSSGSATAPLISRRTADAPQ